MTLLKRTTEQDEMKVFSAKFSSSFTASRFADQKRKEGWDVFEPNPLVVSDVYIVEYWK